MNSSIYLRADGGPQIGWGHINRLSSLADILKNEAKIIAVSTKPGAEIFAANFGELANVKTLEKVVAGNCSKEWEGFHTENAILVLDGYHFDYNYQIQAKQLGFRIVLIDDVASEPFAADMLINHAPNSRSLYKQEGVRYLCGIDYALLRSVFYEAPIPNKRNHNKILLSMGGADPLGLSAQILMRLLPEQQDLRWQVVCTDSFTSEHRQQLENLAEGNHAITLHYNISATEMRQLMIECKYALVSASTVVLEAWASDLYPATLCYIDNQRFMYENVGSGNLAFPVEMQTLDTDFHNYLNNNIKPGSGRKGWNPPQTIRAAFKDLMLGEIIH